MGYFANAGQILIEALFAILTALVVLRVILQLVRANFHNPICQFLYKTTNPVLMPLRKVLPAWRNFDLAGTVVAWLLQVLKVVLLFATLGVALAPLGAAMLGFAHLLDFLMLLAFWTILLRVVLGFLPQTGYHPMVPLVYQITEPLLKPIRRLLPTVAGLDLSPLIATLAIYVARALLVQPLLDLGMYLAA